MSRSLERAFSVALPVERVWHAMTDPDELNNWYFPFAVDDDGVMHTEILGEDRPSEIVEFEPMHRLRMRTTYTGREQWPALPAGTRDMTIVLEALDGGTRVAITHSGFGDDESWEQVLGATAAVSRRRSPISSATSRPASAYAATRTWARATTVSAPENDRPASRCCQRNREPSPNGSDCKPVICSSNWAARLCSECASSTSSRVHSDPANRSRPHGCGRDACSTAPRNSGAATRPDQKRKPHGLTPGVDQQIAERNSESPGKGAPLSGPA